MSSLLSWTLAFRLMLWQSTVLVPVHLATSRPAIKAYLSTLLFLAFSLILVAISTTAYVLFYYSYVPQLGLETTLHLQYGDAAHPHATATLDSSALSSQQPYDISLELHLPRTPTNLAAGNFMLDLSLLSRPSSTTAAPAAGAVPPNSSTPLAHSRRPAILPYQSPLLAVTHNIVALPWHTLGLKDLDADILDVPMFELMSFPRGWRNLPAVVKFELQSEQTLQVYRVRVLFKARFEGLRYILYNYRILSFLVFTSCFYMVSLTSTSIAWFLINAFFRPDSTHGEKEPDRRKKIKQEAGDMAASNGHIKREVHSDHSSDEGSLSISNLSDSATTFPTLGRQMPLRFPVPRPSEILASSALTSSSRTEVKREPDDERVMEATAIEPLAAAGPSEAADDEEEDEPRGSNGRDRDSGIGTSLESEGARDSALGLQRRRSRPSGQSSPK
jgi:seipin